MRFANLKMVMSPFLETLKFRWSISRSIKKYEKENTDEILTILTTAPRQLKKYQNNLCVGGWGEGGCLC